MEDSSPSSPTSAIPQLRFGKIDDLSSRVAAATGAVVAVQRGQAIFY